jgi:hypothetical protein
MARRQPAWLGVGGSAMMATSLFLPWIGGPDVTEGYDDWFPVVLAIPGLALLLAWVRPVWAWVPASVWLVGAAVSLKQTWDLVEEMRQHFPDAHLSPWPWPIAFAGGLCVLMAAWRARVRPQTDVSAFE